MASFLRSGDKYRIELIEGNNGNSNFFCPSAEITETTLGTSSLLISFLSYKKYCPDFREEKGLEKAEVAMGAEVKVGIGIADGAGVKVGVMVEISVGVEKFVDKILNGEAVETNCVG
jgi:hypothetical protein